MNWKVNDRAIIVRASIRPEFIGSACTIIQLLTDDIADLEIEIDGQDGPYYCEANQLRPIDDGKQKASWEDMKDIWVPEVICE